MNHQNPPSQNHSNDTLRNMSHRFDTTPYVANPTVWTRRTWLTTTALVAAATPASLQARSTTRRGTPNTRSRLGIPEDCALPFDPSPWEALAARAVDAAQHAGAQYADVRLTRLVVQEYTIPGRLERNRQLLAVGVRALVNGSWGFAAASDVDGDIVVRAARDAVSYATITANGAMATRTSRTVELGHIPVATGRWATPVTIDPFLVSIEEKCDFFRAWNTAAAQTGIPFDFQNSNPNCFARQERVLATTEGTLCTQAVYESRGQLGWRNGESIAGLEPAGKGWELFLEADILEQIGTARARWAAANSARGGTRPALVGRTTLVCDGATMASMLEQTLGTATQLDRALGYEANGSGTSFVDDPLAMLGQFQLAAPSVNITANRSAPTQLATVKWDDEGVVPEPFTLVKDGVLTDFQTTRESAAWIASYYQRTGKPVRSHGCAAAETGLGIPLQALPNLALTANATGGSLEALVASVADGVLITDGTASTDGQVRTGLLCGGRMRMRKIKNGRLGVQLNGGAILFNTLDFWKNITALGASGTTGTCAYSQYPFGARDPWGRITNVIKGQPVQTTSHTVTAVAAVVPNQALIDPVRRA